MVRQCLLTEKTLQNLPAIGYMTGYKKEVFLSTLANAMGTNAVSEVAAMASGFSRKSN